MTREEAREILTHNWTRVDNPNYSESELDEAFFMAIEALQVMDKAIEVEIHSGEYDVESGIVTYYNVPKAEAVQVVRCKDCRWYERPKAKIFENCCRNNYLIPVKPNDYCSYGERREP